MSALLYYLIIFSFQTTFNIFKVLEIKFTYENKLRQLLINSVFINIVSLGSIFFSLDRLFEGDFFVVPFYIGGSVVGKWIAMKIDNIRFKVFTELFKKK